MFEDVPSSILLVDSNYHIVNAGPAKAEEKIR